MEKIFRIKSLVSAAVVVSGLVLTGCSSDSGSSVTSPNGIYTGNITGGDVSSNGIEEKAIVYGFRMMVLSNKADGVSQIFDNNLSESTVSLTGTGMRYGASGVDLNEVGYDGSFSSGQSIVVNFTELTTGAITLPSGTMNLVASTSLYSKGSDLSRLAGTWTGTFVVGSQMVLNIDASGVIGGSSGDQGGGADCGFTGAFNVLEASVNVYAVNLISDGGSAFGCFVSAGTYTGLAWTEGDTNGTLVLMAADGNRGRAVVLTKN